MYNEGGPVTVTDTNFYSNTISNTAPPSGGSAVYHTVGTSFSGTLKLSKVTFRNPQPPHDSMIVANEPMEWTCQLGQWAPSTGTIDAANFTGCPYLCPSGTVGLATGLTSANDCTACPTGQQCPEAGMGAGLKCAVGKRSPGVGAQACLNCGPGTATDQVGQASCTPCRPGSATTVEGSSTCTACGIGEYASGNGTVACKGCPSFATTDVEGSSSIDACKCAKGFYEDVNDAGSMVCSACPVVGCNLSKRANNFH